MSDLKTNNCESTKFRYNVPEEKYRNDPEYHRLVDTFLSLIVEARFTPSEIREASLLACIKYEQNRTRQIIDPPF